MKGPPRTVLVAACLARWSKLKRGLGAGARLWMTSKAVAVVVVAVVVVVAATSRAPSAHMSS